MNPTNALIGAYIGGLIGSIAVSLWMWSKETDPRFTKQLARNILLSPIFPALWIYYAITIGKAVWEDATQ